MRCGSWLTLTAVGFGSLGCFNLEVPPELEPSNVNSCQTDADCGRNSCRAGACSVGETQLSALLLEITPPITQERFQGARTYYTLGLGGEGLNEHDVKINYPRAVRGEIGLVFGAADCRPSPVRVSFVPVEAHLGLETPRYTTVSEVGTAIVDKKHVDTHRYSLSGIPEGTYDVYLEDANLVDNSQRPECEVAPQSIRSLSIFSEEGASRYVRDLIQSQVRTLRVVVPGSSSFAGWEVDVIHPATRERLSSRAILPTPVDESTPMSVSLRLSQVMGPDFIGSNRELLRLSPPRTVSAPTVTMVLAGLEVFEPGEALVPAVDKFPRPVTYQTWVWRSLDGGNVDGEVQFTALALDAIPTGVNTTLERRAQIVDGLLEVQLPPGRYLARVIPEFEMESPLPQHETEITVWPSPASETGAMASQGGHVIVVPEASTVSGRVRYNNEGPPTGTQVIAKAIDDWPAPFWQPAAHLVPGGSALLAGGEFALDVLTCPDCETSGSGAAYNFVVKPSEVSGLPWAIVVDQRVSSAAMELDISLELPRVVSGFLSVNTSVGPVVLPRVSVRAWALVGKDGYPLREVGLPRCNELSPSVVETLPNCAAQVLEVASTRTADDGTFALLLPQGLVMRESPDGGS